MEDEVAPKSATPAEDKEDHCLNFLFMDMTWNARTCRAMERLARYGLNLDERDLTFADICQFSERDLLRLYGFGRKSLAELTATLSEFGWKLADQSHTGEELNRRFRTADAPSWWDWVGYIRNYRSSEAYKEWQKRLAEQAAQPTFSIPTDPEAYAEWRRTGKIQLCQTK